MGNEIDEGWPKMKQLLAGMAIMAILVGFIAMQSTTFMKPAPEPTPTPSVVQQQNISETQDIVFLVSCLGWQAVFAGIIILAAVFIVPAWAHRIRATALFEEPMPQHSPVRPAEAKSTVSKADDINISFINEAPQGSLLRLLLDDAEERLMND